jgi:hypothetical protein
MSTARREDSRLRLSRREIAMIVAFWVVMALLTAANRMLDPRGPGLRQGVNLAGIGIAFLENALWALVTVPLFQLSARLLDRPSRVQRVVVFAVVGIVVALAMDAVMDLAREATFGPPPNARFRGGPRWRPGGLWFLNDLVVYMAIVAAGTARAYSIRFRARQAESLELRAQLADARLDAMRMQLDPHFLGNTLNAISSLVERDPRGVRRMIARLSELLRMTIQRSAAQEIPLREELELLQRYLEIMQVRFQDRLETRIDIDDALLDALVPNLVLQPIVENAIEHGTSKVEGTGRLTLSAQHVGDELVLRVWNNGTMSGDDGETSDGVGVRNTRARLAQLYGDAQRFTLRADDGGTLAELVIPFREAA